MGRISAFEYIVFEMQRHGDAEESCQDIVGKQTVDNFIVRIDEFRTTVRKPVTDGEIQIRTGTEIETLPVSDAEIECVFVGLRIRST